MPRPGRAPSSEGTYVGRAGQGGPPARYERLGARTRTSLRGPACPGVKNKGAKGGRATTLGRAIRPAGPPCSSSKKATTASGALRRPQAGQGAFTPGVTAGPRAGLGGGAPRLRGGAGRATLAGAAVATPTVHAGQRGGPPVSRGAPAPAARRAAFRGGGRGARLAASAFIATRRPGALAVVGGTLRALRVSRGGLRGRLLP